MSPRRRMLGVVLALLLFTSCGPPTVDELAGRSFANVGEFQDVVACSNHFGVFPEWGGDPPVIETEEEALEMADTLLEGEHPRVEEAFKAGNVWVLVDSEGFAFAAMETVGASIGGCSGY